MFVMVPKRYNTKYYEILGVSKNASQDHLKKSYRKAAIKNHPDKGGDLEKELTQAYEVLRDQEKRQIYDQCGGDCRKPMRGQTVVLMLSLEDLYNGATKKLPLSHTVICSECKGQTSKGSKSGALMKCSGCQGSGMKVSIQQMQHPCNECIGAGETINDNDRCQQCKGEKVVLQKNVYEIHVEKGMQNRQKITFPGEALNTVTGGSSFRIEQKEHPKFKRKGDDLFVEHTLSLKEALCGFQFELTHLDYRQLIIKSQP